MTTQTEDQLTTFSPSPSPQPDAFPCFAQGDVLIVLTPLEKLRLHSDVLRNASTLLAGFLTPTNAAVLAKKALTDHSHVRYRLELVDVSHGIGESPGRLLMVRLDTNGHPVRDPNAPRASMYLSSHGADPALGSVLPAWRAVFGTMYGQEIHFHHGGGGGDDLAGLIRAASTILDIVDHLQLRNKILTPLELALLGNEQRLWKSVCTAPIAWAGLGTRLKSFPIWREAVLHVVGGWNEWTEAQKSGLRRDVGAFVEKKAKRFDEFKEGLEQKLLGYRHKKIDFDAGEQPKGKKIQESDVFYWQAQWLWVDWLARRFREGMGRRAKDGGWGLYKMIWEGAWADPMEQRKASPLTESGMKVVRQIIGEMMADLQKIVAGVMVSKLKLEHGQMVAERLTNFTIELKDAPWDTKKGKHRAKRRRVEPDHLHLPNEDDDELD
ncbi:hypothetical protein SLS57_003237 [Botryosphaeria dothidea]